MVTLENAIDPDWMRPRYTVTYERLDQWVYSLQPALLQHDFACVVGVLRGGGPLALMVSHTTGAPVAFLRYDRSLGHVAWDSSIPLPVPGATVLLCEDIAGMGDTFVDCIEFLRARGLRIVTMTVGFDERSRIRPDYGMDLGGAAIHFPWERHACTVGLRNAHRGARQGLRKRPDHAYERYAFDLDGVLRDAKTYDGHEDMLDLARERARVVISTRVEVARAQTTRWLRDHGITDVDLVMRDPMRYDLSGAKLIAYKVDALDRHRCTHMIEADPTQSIAIAGRLPLLRTVWWDHDSDTGRLVSADAWTPPEVRHARAALGS